jgi:hypothetical protein
MFVLSATRKERSSAVRIDQSRMIYALAKCSPAHYGRPLILVLIIRLCCHSLQQCVQSCIVWVSKPDLRQVPAPNVLLTSVELPTPPVIERQQL